jgi:hypothetical protein
MTDQEAADDQKKLAEYKGQSHEINYFWECFNKLNPNILGFRKFCPKFEELFISWERLVKGCIRLS